MPRVREKTLKTVKVESKLEEGFKVVTKARNHIIIQDLPVFAGGKDEGPLPPELLLASLAGCIGIVGKYHASRFGINLKGMEIIVEGDYDPRGFAGEDVKPGFQSIRVRVIFNAPGSDEDKLKKFMDFISKHCPIADTLRSPTEISVSVELAS